LQTLIIYFFSESSETVWECAGME